MKKIIVVTGGSGFVGSNLIALLIEKTKFDIISIDNYSSGKKKKSYKKQKSKIYKFTYKKYFKNFSFT